MLLPKTMLLCAHIIGVVFGLGGVLMLDLNLLKFLRGARIADQDIALTRFISAFVKLGLILLWASGLMIISISPDGPAAVLANPKLQAKIVIVIVLTINALFVETLGLPLLYANRGKALFDGVGHLRRSIILASGAVSTLSWSFPLVLGLAREWSFKIPAHTILLSYAAAVTATILALAVASFPFRSALAAKRAARLWRENMLADYGAVPVRPASSEAELALKRHEAAMPKSEASLLTVLMLARQAGTKSLADVVSVERVAENFAALQSDSERQEFRAGLFSALQNRLGTATSVDQFAQTVANDPDLREKFAIVAPDQTGLNVFHTLMNRVDALKANPAQSARAASTSGARTVAWDEVARRLRQPQAYGRA